MKFHTMRKFATIQYDLLNCYISKVFSNSDQNLTPFDPPVLNSQRPELSEISCSEDKVWYFQRHVTRFCHCYCLLSHPAV